MCCCYSFLHNVTHFKFPQLWAAGILCLVLNLGFPRTFLSVPVLLLPFSRTCLPEPQRLSPQSCFLSLVKYCDFYLVKNSYWEQRGTVFSSPSPALFLVRHCTLSTIDLLFSSFHPNTSFNQCNVDVCAAGWVQAPCSAANSFCCSFSDNVPENLIRMISWSSHKRRLLFLFTQCIA